MSSNTSNPLEQLFSNPPSEYYPVPWWAWNGRLTPVKIHAHIKMMYDQGLREFFVFPLYGMETEYLGEDYFRDIEFTLNECRKLGMKIWIYDEFNWPSGMAGGRIPRLHPEAIGHEVRAYERSNLSQAEFDEMMADSCVIHAAAIKTDGTMQPVRKGEQVRSTLAFYRVERDNCVSITSYGSLWSIPERGMLDMLSIPAVGKFLEEAYEPFARRFPGDCGITIKGFFTDEPVMGFWGELPWTDDIAALFMDRYGYDLIPKIHDLTYETPGFERTRAHYWALISDIKANAYMEQIADWCETRGMQITGHLSFEEGSMSIWCHGDTPRVMKHMHAPGCDLLGLKNSYDPEAVLGEYRVITAKVTSSSARAGARKRCMCEAFGVAPWTRTMADEKHMTDWLCALGINMINDNTLVADISGFRKRGASGKHFTQPWWFHERTYYDYAARTSALVSETMLDTEIGVLYPSTTWHSLVERNKQASPRLQQYEQALNTALNALVFKHWDFEFLFEDSLAAAKIEDCALVTEYGTFRTIIVAGISLVPAAAAAKLQQFAAAGGMIVTLGSDLASLDHSSATPFTLPRAVDFSNWQGTLFRSDFDPVLRQRVSRSWTINGENAEGVITSARTDAYGTRILFIANMTPGDKTLDITWISGASVECWEAARAEKWTPAQQSGAMQLHLPEDESVWLVQKQATTENTIPPAQFTIPSAPAMELSGDWNFSIQPANIYSLKLKLKTDPNGSLDPLSLKPDSTWVDVNEGDAGIPLRPEEMQCYWLYSEFNLVSPIPDLQLGVDSDEIEAAWVNGQKLGDNRQFAIWDDENRIWDISPLLVGKSRGEVLLRVRPSPYYAKGLMEIPREHYPLAALPITITYVEPVVLRGSFAVKESAGIGTLTPPPATMITGDWTAHGYPHFFGTGIYRKTFDWGGASGDVLIDLDSGRDVAEVLLDRKSLGKRAWGPRRFRGWITPGQHTIEVRITNNLGNLLRRAYDVLQPTDPVPAGLIAPVTISKLEEKGPLTTGRNL